MSRNTRSLASTYLGALLVLGTLVLGATPAAAAPRKPPSRPHGRDTTPPTIVVPADITTGAMATIGAYVAYTVTVADDKDPAPTVTYSHPSGSTFPIGSTTVTVTATDWKLNTSTATFNVTVLAPTATSFSYEMDLFAYDYDLNVVVWYAWSITVDADGTVSGSGEQAYLLESYSAYWDEYAAPMPAGLTGNGTIGGTISPDGSSSLDESGNYWWLDAYDYGDEGVLTDSTFDFSVTAQASLDANGNLSFSGDYYAFWTKVS